MARTGQEDRNPNQHQAETVSQYVGTVPLTSRPLMSQYFFVGKRVGGADTLRSAGRGGGDRTRHRTARTADVRSYGKSNQNGRDVGEMHHEQHIDMQEGIGSHMSGPMDGNFAAAKWRAGSSSLGSVAFSRPA